MVDPDIAHVDLFQYALVRMMTSTKSFYNYPCSHRQWRHPGHCAFVHGYSRSFHFQFQADKLTDTGFVVDFGDLKDVKKWLDDTFDHTLLLNADDPLMEHFKELERLGAAKIRTMPNVGMEGTAAWVWTKINSMFWSKYNGKRWCTRVEVRENEKNSAFFQGVPAWAARFMPC